MSARAKSNSSAFTMDSAGPTLANLPVGQRAHIRAVDLMDGIGDRLAELGLTPGAPVEVLRRGIFGGPVQVRVRDFALSLRRCQAGCVSVASEAA